MLNSSAPTMPPTVLAAYTRPTSRPASWPGAAAAAIAIGKLAPHSSAAGRMVQAQRIMSNCSSTAGLLDNDGFTGQYGNDRAIM